MAGRMIEYAANGGTAQGYLAEPAPGQGSGKGVIVIQEWWGLVPHIREVADRFAAAGFIALAPDFWDGQQTKKPDEAGRLFMALNVEDATKKLRGAAAALHAHGAKGKLGVVGFCMGGQLALYAAGALPDEIGACADFYGVHPNVKPDYAKIRGPVLLCIGEHDGSVPPATGREIAAKIQAAGGACDLHVFDAGHAFFNDHRPEAYHEASAKKAWELTLQLMG
jgi:carboxymethylenebutenolidase